MDEKYLLKGRVFEILFGGYEIFLNKTKLLALFNKRNSIIECECTFATRENALLQCHLQHVYVFVILISIRLHCDNSA